MDRVADTPFAERHIGPTAAEQQKMLDALGFASLEALIDDVVPADIRLKQALDLPEALSESQALAALQVLAHQNVPKRSLIGQGYYDTITPPVILRNVLENPAWYTAYTPYQAEISQGRLEALLNFQTMVMDLTGLEIANASLLDEATAAAEAMVLARNQSKAKTPVFLVDTHVHPQTIDVLLTRARYLDIDVQVTDCFADALLECFGALVQTPDTRGQYRDLKALAAALHDKGAVLCAASDLLAMTLFTPAGEMGADIVVGNSQRFGVPMGFGGPHAAFMATRDSFKRNMPGRLVGVSKDSHGKPAYRLALQTREQHIRREKATSNVCTAQALLAIMAGCYAVYHGADGLRAIAGKIHALTSRLAHGMTQAGFAPCNRDWFDTLQFDLRSAQAADDVMARALDAGFNLRRFDENIVGLALDERSDVAEVAALLKILSGKDAALPESGEAIAGTLARQSAFLTHPVFTSYHNETAMMRYLRKLSDFDLALDRSMIPLGSCTMKLNAAAEMQGISWPAFAGLHPFAPVEQTQGYRELFTSLEKMLATISGYDAVSLQPNSGASGEYAGLLVIRNYHESRGEGHRDVCLIPASAHGTNPASAALAGMKVVIVKCTDSGDIDLDDLRAKAAEHQANLAAIMVTYPSTHGIFERHIRDVCQVVHEAGGQVYLDGANLNAQVALAAPGLYGSDVSHFNLHKTFAIPHGGGGPGVGPIGVRAHLAPFLPGHSVINNDGGGLAVSAAPWGSALITLIPWMYIRMMGENGLRRATALAILNANYIVRRLRDEYPILYTDENGFVAHECIVDVRGFKDSAGISVDDFAKRLMDYGFHAPTMSFPVPGTLMIEPTESEPLAELDRFCDAMLAIREEVRKVEKGEWPRDDNPLVHAPHTLADLTGDWQRSYDRRTAVFPVPGMNPAKYFTPVNRIDNVYGDRHVMCTCPPLESYE